MIQIYDPAMCCSTGVCGTEVDQKLVVFAADVAWAKGQGIEIERFNLSQQPLAFADNEVVKNFLKNSGASSLPLILVNGNIVLAGRYPTRQELATWGNVALAPCCTNNKCC